MYSRAVTLTIAVTLTCVAPLAAQRSSCGPAQQPKELPSVSFLIDSSSALMELQAAKVLRDSMQFTLFIVPADSIPVIHALDSTDAMAASLLARSAWPSKTVDLWAVRVHITGGTAPALTLSRPTYCPPALTPGSKPVHLAAEIREERITSNAQLLQVQRVVQGPAPIPLVCEIAVTERGDVNEVKVIRSSGNREVDQHVAQQLAQQQYEPALLDGIPVPAIIRTSGKDDRGPLVFSRP